MQDQEDPYYQQYITKTHQREIELVNIRKNFY